jgi:enoyl-CoA hydratase/carnithine racemase
MADSCLPTLACMADERKRTHRNAGYNGMGDGLNGLNGNTRPLAHQWSDVFNFRSLNPQILFISIMLSRTNHAARLLARVARAPAQMGGSVAATSATAARCAPHWATAAAPLAAANAPVRRFSSAAAATTAASPSSTSSASSDEQAIVLDRRADGVVVIKFNRPSSLNAMTVRMGEQFRDAITSLSTDGSVRAVVLTGEGTAFSAGGDLDFLLSRCESAPEVNSAQMRAFYARFMCLYSLPVPIIAAINGPAIGAGACVAAACDLRVAARDTDIGFTFVKLGLHPGMACTHTLPRLIGQENASRLLLTGEIIKGSRAAQLGLVGELVESSGDVLPAALKLAASIASQPPVAVRTLTTSLRLHHQNDMERALWREADAQALCYATTQLKDNVTAMINKSKNKKKKPTN